MLGNNQLNNNKYNTLISWIGWNSWYDGYRFGEIKATFANDIDDTLESGSSVWTTPTNFCDGCGAPWYQMTKQR